MNEADEPRRLSKVVAALVPCSRREAEQYIAEGWVRVDGRVVQEPQFRVAGEQVEIDRKARLQDAGPVTLLLHKTAGIDMAAALALLGPATHWPGEASGLRFIANHLRGLIEPSPLPEDAAGLCVFTQDRGIVRRLQEDARGIEQELVAEVAGSIAPGGLARLCGGLVFEGRPLPPARVSWQSETRLRIATKDLPPARVAWMCSEVGLRLMSLKRIRIGRVAMAGLPPGQWRYLAATERF